MKFRIVKDLYETTKNKMMCSDCSDCSEVYIIQRKIAPANWESIEWCNSIETAKSLIKFYDKLSTDQYEVLYEVDIPMNQVRKIKD